MGSLAKDFLSGDSSPPLDSSSLSRISYPTSACPGNDCPIQPWGDPGEALEEATACLHPSTHCSAPSNTPFSDLPLAQVPPCRVPVPGPGQSRGCFQDRDASHGDTPGSCSLGGAGSPGSLRVSPVLSCPALLARSAGRGGGGGGKERKKRREKKAHFGKEVP